MSQEKEESMMYTLLHHLLHHLVCPATWAFPWDGSCEDPSCGNWLRNNLPEATTNPER